MNPLLKIVSNLDLTEAFKTKGNLKRWSAKRTMGGLVVGTACEQILVHGCSWQLVVLCAIGVAPLCLSFFEKDVVPCGCPSKRRG